MPSLLQINKLHLKNMSWWAGESLMEKLMARYGPELASAILAGGGLVGSLPGFFNPEDPYLYTGYDGPETTGGVDPDRPPGSSPTPMPNPYENPKKPPRNPQKPYQPPKRPPKRPRPDPEDPANDKLPFFYKPAEPIGRWFVNGKLTQVQSGSFRKKRRSLYKYAKKL